MSALDITAEASGAPPTRDLILDAAERLFAERGFAGVSVRDIVAETPLKNQASLYNHFSNKRALYEAVLARGLDDIVGLLPERGDTGRPADTNLDRLVDYLADHPHLARLIQRAALDDSRYLESAVTRLLRPLYTQGRRALAAAELWQPEEVPHLAAGLYHLIFGYFANAALLEAVVMKDPLHPEAVERQRRFLKAAVARLLGVPQPPSQPASARTRKEAPFMQTRSDEGTAVSLDNVDLANPDSFLSGVPHDAFKLLRAEAPVFWHPEPDGPGFWAVTKHADVTALTHDWATFSSGRKGVFLFDPPAEDLANMKLMMVNMDPPEHTKLRRLVKKGFTPRMLALIEPHIRELAKRIVDGIAAKGECDFVTEVAAELPLQVIAEMLGIPLEDRHLVFDWSNRLIGFDDPEYQTSYDDGKVAAAEMYVYANRLALERKKKPGDDLVSVLMDAEVDGEKMTELQFDLFFLLLAVAGNETTRNAISGGMLALMEHPQERARLLAEPSLMPTAIDEMLRWVSPVMYFRRTATQDTEVRGQRIREGDKVAIYYVSANRDEEVFDDADRFDVGRTPNEHIAFGGGGPHYCLGANLAPLEMRIMFEELLHRLPDMEPAGPVTRLRSNFINGIKHMPVKFTPAGK